MRMMKIFPFFKIFNRIVIQKRNTDDTLAANVTHTHVSILIKYKMINNYRNLYSITTTTTKQ